VTAKDIFEYAALLAAGVQGLDVLGNWVVAALEKKAYL
jgi:hypothetical protein